MLLARTRARTVSSRSVPAPPSLARSPLAHKPQVCRGDDRRGQTILINALLHFVKRKPKNVLTDEGIAAVVDAYRAWETRPKLNRVVSLEEIRAADYNLSPSQFVEVADRIEHRPLPEILADLATARAERERADSALEQVLTDLGLLDAAMSAKM